MLRFSIIFLFILLFVSYCLSSEGDVKEKKKSLVDYTDADLERLYEQWHENDEDEDEPDLPPLPTMPPPTQLNLDDLKNKDPDELKMMSKKGQAVMIFVTVSGSPTKEESNEITSLWHQSLKNANYQINRFMVDDNRAIFMTADGSRAFEIKNYLVKQGRCLEVTIDNENYPGVAVSKAKIDL